MAQNEQRRSHPLASLSGAIGPPPRRRRTVRGPVAGAPAPISSTELAWPGTAIAEAARSTGEMGRSRRRSDGRVGLVGLAPDDRAEPGGDVGVVVEAQDGVGLRQRLGEVLAVALGQAADGHDGLGTAAGLLQLGLEVGRLQQRVDRVLLGRLDEAAGVHDHGVGVGGVVDEQEAVGLEPAGELLGVDLVAGAPERHHRDRGRSADVSSGRGADVRSSHGHPEYDRPGTGGPNRQRRISLRRPPASPRGPGSGRRAGSAARRCP